jgi:hypothetical protein
LASISTKGQSTVHHYLKRAAAAGISWVLAEQIDEGELERRLFPRPLAPIERASLPLLWTGVQVIMLRPPESFGKGCVVQALIRRHTAPDQEQAVGVTEVEPTARRNRTREHPHQLQFAFRR